MTIDPTTACPHTRAMAGKRRTQTDPSKPHKLMVTGLTSAEVAALDALVDRRNRDAAPGFTTSRNALVVAELRALIAREKGGG